ncbi:MAG TPA: protein translocase subunit SecD, partial [Arenimonas sp.]|nr:protein translocase subunit SecD [Arenimonas sp.]
MLEFSRWKYAFVALVLLFSVFYSLPNLYPQDPAVQITANRGATVDAALEQRVKALLDDAGYAYKSVSIEKNSLLVRMGNADEQIQAADLVRPELGNEFTVALNLASTVPAWLEAIYATPMLLGLDLQGGVHFLMQIDRAAALDRHFEAY